MDTEIEDNKETGEEETKATALLEDANLSAEWSLDEAKKQRVNTSPATQRIMQNADNILQEFEEAQRKKRSIGDITIEGVNEGYMNLPPAWIDRDL